MAHLATKRQVAALFDTGWWQELEQQLRCALDREPADAKCAFRLANLLFFRGQWEESLRLFDLCIAQQWPGPLSLNNKGVVLTFMGGARPAIACFQDAAACAPALFNLAILCERLAEDGGILPPVVADTLKRNIGDAVAVAMDSFAQADAALWAHSNALDRPLYLWKEDIPGGFGFASAQVLDDLQEAHTLLASATQLLEEHRWREAIERLDAAAAMHRPIAPQTVEPRNRALIAMCREHRDCARQAWDAGDFDAARASLNELLVLLPELPDKSVVRQILSDEIGSFCDRIRQIPPGPDWGGLQARTAVARLLMTSFQNLLSETNSDGSPAGQAGSPGDDKPAPEIDRLRPVCLQAWAREVEYLRASGRYDDALMLLDMEEWRWFGEPERIQLQRRVYLAKTEALCAAADQATSEARTEDAYRFLAEARESASRAGDSTLVESCDVRLARVALSDSEPDDADLRQLLAAGNFEELLARYEQLVREHSAGPAAIACRSAAIVRLVESAETALRNRHFSEAIKTARLVLSYEPESSRAKAVERAACDNSIDRVAAEVQNAIDRGSFDEASVLLNTAFETDPANPRLIELHRALVAACCETVAGGSDEYDHALQSFLESKAAQNVQTAFESLLKMRTLAPSSAQTLRAWPWIANEFVEYIKRRLEADASPETAQSLLRELNRLLAIDAELKPALALQELLLAAIRGSEQERRSTSGALLRLAEKACNDLDPGEAMNHIRQLEELDDPGHRAGTAVCKQRALRQLQTKIKWLIAENTSQTLDDAENLIRILKQWDESAAAPLDDRWHERKQALENRVNTESALVALRGLAAQYRDAPRKILRNFDRQLAGLLLIDPPVLTAKEQRELLELRASIVAACPWWARLRQAKQNGSGKGRYES